MADVLGVKLLRTRAGLSMREMAEAVGLKGPSGWQFYEAPRRDGAYLPIEWRDAVTEKLAGRGSPPISVEEVDALFGAEPRHAGLAPMLVRPSCVAEAERYVALASPINAAPKDIVRHLFVNILGLAMEGDHGE